MKLERVVKPLVVGGVVAATMFSPIQPLRKMEFGQTVAYAANVYKREVKPFVERKNDYVAGKTFKDVPSGRWYSQIVEQAYKLGLITGKPNQLYDPNGDVTIAEVLVMAAKLNSYGIQGEYTQYTGTNPWYWHGVEWCENHGIIKPNEFDGRYNDKARRDEVAHILANVFDERQYEILNPKPAYSDITERNTKYVDDINVLYQAGILSGKDNLGNFYPAHNITRAEMASVLMRMAIPKERDNRGFPVAGNSAKVVHVDEIDKMLAERNKNNPSTTSTPNKPNTEKTSSNYSTTDKEGTPNKPSRKETPNTANTTNTNKKEETSNRTERPSSSERPNTNNDETPNKTETNNQVPEEPEIKFVTPGSTNPNPSDYADWFFDEYLKGPDFRLKGTFDPLPQNWEACSEEIINRLRAKEGSTPIKFNPTLAKASKIRAEELHTSFSHKRPNGESRGSLYREVGYRQPGEDLGGCAENITGSNGENLPDALYRWMLSPGHYELIITDLGPSYQEEYGLAYHTLDNITYWSYNTGDYKIK